VKRWIPAGVVVVALFWTFANLLPSALRQPEAVTEFGRLPVLAEGRIKPLDSVARSTLLVLQGRQRVVKPDGAELTPDEWLLDVLFRPELADSYKVFVVDNVDLLSLIGKSEDSMRIHYDKPIQQLGAILDIVPTTQRRVSFNEIQPYLAQVEAQEKLAEPVEAQSRTRFQSAVVQLYTNLVHYVRLRRALVPEGTTDLLQELFQLNSTVDAGVEAVRRKEAGQAHDDALAQAMIDEGQKFVAMSDSTDLLALPPEEGDKDPTAWRSMGHALLQTFGHRQVDPLAFAYAGMAYAWRHQSLEQLGTIVQKYNAALGKQFAAQVTKVRVETLFNQAEPFYACMLIYLAAFLCAVLSWLRWPETSRRAASGLVILGWVLATVGIGVRMWLEGRPPVTNLYSSALFIGWGAVALCLFLEGTYKNAIGAAAAGLIGFCTLLIAHHLALAGDTLEMMRAVLDSNFWLATHVVVVTTGYASTFLAGILAFFYVLRGVATKTLDRATADGLARMIYGVVCFATLFSFVGTTLGGIWADQSWGRFWGWDPKENGALIIVVWNALILHARWGGMVKQRGLVALALFGNVVTSWSWFGTNMLGIGLHSYGFTEAAFWWLAAFIATQLALIGVANLPLRYWRSREALQGPLPADRPLAS